MTGLHKRELALLLLGDIVIFFVSLWLSLAIRGLGSPTEAIFYNHLAPFSMLFVVWVAVFYIAGLYDKQTVLVKKYLPGMILRAQITNIILAALFFFTVSAYGITPKTVLVIYLIISTALILAWRLYVSGKLFGRRKQRALLIGESAEARELIDEVNNNSRYDVVFVAQQSPDAFAYGSPTEKLRDIVARESVQTVVVDYRDQRIAALLPTLFSYAFFDRRISIIDFVKVYESIFDRVPISLLTYDWFLKNVSGRKHALYAIVKRVIDIIGSLIIGFFTVAAIPFIFLAIMLEDGGSIFIKQVRMGRGKRPMVVYKFRTMTVNESTSNTWVGESHNRVTRVGRYLRNLSIDEWPQVWNILKGEMSLIGPRNDIAGLAERLEEHIPYYAIRTVITPGLTGWAQTHQRYAPGNISPQSVEETKLRLAYDLFYIKHRSLLLDLGIALRTIKTLLSRIGTKTQSLVR